ncbi:MAG: SIMPL domain-containing protein, partial [Patescibacteria group bacterium]
MMEGNKCCAQHKILGVIAVIVLLLLGAYLFSLSRNSLKNYNYIGKSPEFQDRVTITGEGKVTATPDVAVVSVGVLADKSTVAQAQKESTDKINSI